MITYVSIIIYTFVNGEIKFIGKPYDPDRKYKLKLFLIDMACGADYSDYPYIYFVYPD